MVYSGNPATSTLDAVRFWLQDTSSAPLLADAELSYVITTVSDWSADPLLIAATCCAPLAARFAQVANISADGVSYSGAELQDKFTKLRASLQDQYDRLHRGDGAPSFAGWCAPTTPFRLGQHDNPLADPQPGIPGSYDPALDPGNYQP